MITSLRQGARAHIIHPARRDEDAEIIIGPDEQRDPAKLRLTRDARTHKLDSKHAGCVFAPEHCVHAAEGTACFPM